ncbi:MAG: hypothetical protein WBL63_19730 [Candidatus Acidiferrum sp.]
MYTPTLFRLAALAILVGLTTFSLPAQDQGSDDVAAAARKARQQQKNAPKPAKVITNDDIPPAKNAAAPASDSKDAKASGQQDRAQTDDKDTDNDPKSEAYWRKRFKKAHDKLDQAEKELDILQRELDKNQLQYYPDPQKALMQENNRSDINEKTTKINAKKKEIEAIKQEISDLEDDLRKAGGDPGWAR